MLKNLNFIKKKFAYSLNKVVSLYPKRYKTLTRNDFYTSLGVI